MILKERTIPKTEAERDPEKESSPKCWERPCERRHRGPWDWEERLGKSELGQLGILCASCWEILALGTKLPSHGFFSLGLLPVDQVSGRTVGPWGSTEGSWRTPPPMGRRKGKCPGPGLVRVQFCLGRDYCCSIFMQPCDYEMSSKHLFSRCKPCCSASRFDLTLGGRRVGGQPPSELFSESKSPPNKLVSA